MLKAAWENQDNTVHGAALAGKAAEGMQSYSGIAACTLASLEGNWKNGYNPIGSGDALGADEAGMMVGSRQMMRIATKLPSIGAKLVMVGDPDQLQPIEAGHTFRRLIETNGAAKLRKTHRQREEWQGQASRWRWAIRVRPLKAMINTTRSPIARPATPRSQHCSRAIWRSLIKAAEYGLAACCSLGALRTASRRSSGPLLTDRPAPGLA